jgi:hypothetical protein
MTKVKKATTNAPSAWIVNSLDRGRKSIKQNNVYLNDKEEFLIELYNPLQQPVLTEIKLNGNSISTSGLVLNPGQRYYLDCFIDDNKKFIFNTYDVDDSNETANATEKNGLLEVFFYKESVVNLSNWNRYNPITRTIYGGTVVFPYGGAICGGSFGGPTYYYGNGILGHGSTCGVSGATNTGTSVNMGNSTFTSNSAYANTSVNMGNSTFTSSACVNNSLNTSSIETGRVGKGDKSSQKFETVDMNFDSYHISSTILKLLPNSRKPVETKEIDKSKVKESNQVIDLIKKLSDLYESGILTEDEFSNKKKDLLSKI